MSRRDRRRIGAGLLLLGWGAALLARPERIADVVGGGIAPPSWIVRVLGARGVLQETVVLLAPSRRAATAAAGADVLHALSMLAAAAIWPRYRRCELASAGIAAGSALVTVATARSG